ncbi:sugar MFS transporter [Dyadobacter aurulentus]|uniref:sugar MFS transporter n=1 Tax=Dyadobacter sp. UC 10 TaxID=2605428 RepID=UPI0011F1069F|nr:sugar MFS transporter [Dyadobacter sp. UC 10]KAA0988744.1 sugar MFS transporter [Dyadobacter sp. UC 10]
MAGIPVGNAISSGPADRQVRSYTPALITLAVLYFMMGFITCLNDTLVPFFKKGFRLNYAESSLVQFYFFLTYGIVSIPAGRIVGGVGYKKGMVLGFSIAALGALLFFPAAVMHQYALFLAALFVLAIGIVLLQVAANPYITVLGAAKTASSRLTLIQGVGSIGTTTAPLFGAYYILAPLQTSAASSAAVKYPYLGIAAVLVIIAFIVSRLALPEIEVEESNNVEDQNSAKGIFAFRNLNYGIFGLFFYVGAEVSVGTFLTNYIADLLKTTESAANNFVAFYWGGMLVGRLIGAVLLKSVKASVMLSVCAGLAIVLVILSINTSGYVAVWSMIAVGFCNSVMFAIIFSLAVNGLGKYTTQASGLLSAAIAGGAVISFCQGMLIDNTSWTIAFVLPVACYSYILFYGLSGYKSKFSNL